MIFYHWTTKSALESIKENGLVPCRGQHCMDIRDRTDARIFLCKEPDINFWRSCFYNVEVLLSISVEEEFMYKNMNCRRASLSPSKMEYSSRVPIPKEMIVDIRIIDRDDFAGDERRYKAKYHIA